MLQLFKRAIAPCQGRPLWVFLSIPSGYQPLLVANSIEFYKIAWDDFKFSTAVPYTRKTLMKNDNNDLSHHILPNSATMVGVCIMVISIVKSQPADMVNYLIDKALAIDSVLFTVSALLSFLSIRLQRATEGFERWAEMIFILGLVSMTLIAVIFSFEIV